jgi:hypothetical protein
MVWSESFSPPAASVTRQLSSTLPPLTLQEAKQVKKKQAKNAFS